MLLQLVHGLIVVHHQRWSSRIVALLKVVWLIVVVIVTPLAASRVLVLCVAHGVGRRCLRAYSKLLGGPVVGPLRPVGADLGLWTRAVASEGALELGIIVVWIVHRALVIILLIVLVLMVVGILLSVPRILSMNSIWIWVVSSCTTGIVSKVQLLLIAFAVRCWPLSVNAISHLIFFIIL